MAAARPAHKRVPDSPFLVDSFRWPGTKGLDVHVLTHFHGDHYGGLDERWDRGTIVCTAITADLVEFRLGVDRKWVRALALKTPYDDVAPGWTVTLLDANHCPGAAVVCFAHSASGRQYVHVGDFRYIPSMVDDPTLAAYRGCDAIFLDNTYCNPRYRFPPQERSIEYAADRAAAALLGDNQVDGAAARALAAAPQKLRSDVVVIVSTYVIGKERILIRMAECLKRHGLRILVERRKLQVLRRLRLPEWLIDADPPIFVTDDAHEPYHVRVTNMESLGTTFPFFKPNWEAVGQLSEATERPDVMVVGIVPTGWTFAAKANGGGAAFASREKDGHVIHLVPYSEHSSFDELRAFVAALKPVSVVPTVGCDAVTEATADPMKVKAYRDVMKHVSALTDSVEKKRRFVTAMAVPSKTAAKGAEGAITIADGDSESDDGDACPPDFEEPAAAHPAAGTSLRLDRADVECPICLRMQRANAINAHVASCMERQTAMGAPVRPSRPALPVAKRRKSDSASQPPQRPIGRGSAPSTPATTANSPGAAPRAKNKQATLASFFGRPSEAVASTPSQTNRPPPTPPTVASPPPRDMQAAATPSSIVREEANAASTPSMKAAEQSLERELEANLQLPPEAFDPRLHAPSPIVEGSTNGGSLPYLHLARTYRLVSAERGRIKTIAMLCNMLHAVLALTPHDLVEAILMTLNDVDGIATTDGEVESEDPAKLQVGGGAVSQAIMEATGSSQAVLRRLYRETGDIGDVVHALRQRQSTLVRPKPLTVHGVAEAFKELAGYSGQGSVLRKRGVLVRLLRASNQDECKWLARTAIRHLRIGATATLVLTSLGRAAAYAAERARCERGATTAVVAEEELSRWSDAVLSAYHIFPNLPAIVRALLDGGVDRVRELAVVHPGTPMQPMLAKVARSVDDVIEKLSESSSGFVCQFKYDGMRCQIHMLGDGSIRLFSRNCEDFTAMWPEVVQLVTSWREASSSGGAVVDCVLDAEVVAVDGAGVGRRLLAFQNLSTRSRGPTTAATAAAQPPVAPGNAVRVLLVVFDVLGLNGASLVATPLKTRLVQLSEVFSPRVQPGVFELAEQRAFGPASEGDGGSSKTAEAVQSYLEESIGGACEGLMAKALTSAYEPSKRSDFWMKLKRDMCGMADTLDVVPIGAWYGNGRKAGWFSPWLVAVYDKELGTFQCLCRVLSGFSDAFYEAKTKEYTDRGLLDRPPSYVDCGERCSVYFTPFEVWEILGQEVSVSPVHRAAAHLSGSGSGFSLRFPRFVRLREDKSIEQASDASQVAAMHRR